jgi:hypothetical protein
VLGSFIRFCSCTSGWKSFYVGVLALFGSGIWFHHDNPLVGDEHRYVPLGTVYFFLQSPKVLLFVLLPHTLISVALAAIAMIVDNKLIARFRHWGAGLPQLVAHGDETGQETILIDGTWQQMQQEARS